MVPQRKRTNATALYLFLCVSFAGLLYIPYVHNTITNLRLPGTIWAVVATANEGQRGEPSAGQARDICSRFIPSSTTEFSSTSSTSSVWKELKHQILNASYLPLEHAPNVTFWGWIDTLFHFYATERLRRSISNPASTSTVRHILKILSDYPATKEPLRILVMGGSVTAGVVCKANPLGLPGGPNKGHFKDCAWAARLEYLMNHVFFGGERVVQVSNLAVGGTSSEIGAIQLEYQLLPKDMEIPHIVMLAYSANDSTEGDKDRLFYQHMQDAVQAAHNLRQCDDDLPLVVMVDDFYGSRPHAMMEHTARVYSISSWYQIMSVNYANVVRNAVYGKLCQLLHHRSIDGKPL
jgi:hypothetical protein